MRGMRNRETCGATADFIRCYKDTDEEERLFALAHVIGALLFHEDDNDDLRSRALLRMRIADALRALVKAVRIP